MTDWPTKEECAAFYDLMTNPTKTYWLGVEKERQANRVAKFGAIRRAAEVARYCDGEANGTGRFGIIPARTPDEERLSKIPAKAVRQAIRAAIGSPKA